MLRLTHARVELGGGYVTRHRVSCRSFGIICSFRLPRALEHARRRCARAHLQTKAGSVRRHKYFAYSEGSNVLTIRGRRYACLSCLDAACRVDLRRRHHGALCNGSVRHLKLEQSRRLWLTSNRRLHAARQNDHPSCLALQSDRSLCATNPIHPLLAPAYVHLVACMLCHLSRYLDSYRLISAHLYCFCLLGIFLTAHHGRVWHLVCLPRSLALGVGLMDICLESSTGRRPSMVLLFRSPPPMNSQPLRPSLCGRPELKFPAPLGHAGRLVSWFLLSDRWQN